MIDLSQHTLADLRKLQEQVKEEMKSREAQEIQRAREQILAIAQGVGLPLEALLAKGVKGIKKPGSVAVRFQHPENESQKWTGRGRQPKWVKEWVDSGKELDKLLVS